MPPISFIDCFIDEIIFELIFCNPNILSEFSNTYPHSISVFFLELLEFSNRIFIMQILVLMYYLDLLEIYFFAI